MPENTLNSPFNSAALCRRNGWKEGTRLIGDQGYGPTTIEITAVGEREVLAKTVARGGDHTVEMTEGLWDLRDRDWKEVGA